MTVSTILGAGAIRVAVSSLRKLEDQEVERDKDGDGTLGNPKDTLKGRMGKRCLQVK